MLRVGNLNHRLSLSDSLRRDGNGVVPGAPVLRVVGQLVAIKETPVPIGKVTHPATHVGGTLAVEHLNECESVRGHLSANLITERPKVGLIAMGAVHHQNPAVSSGRDIPARYLLVRNRGLGGCSGGGTGYCGRGCVSRSDSCANDSRYQRDQQEGGAAHRHWTGRGSRLDDVSNPNVLRVFLRIPSRRGSHRAPAVGAGDGVRRNRALAIRAGNEDHGERLVRVNGGGHYDAARLPFRASFGGA
jgi:hypothetical protein